MPIGRSSPRSTTLILIMAKFHFFLPLLCLFFISHVLSSTSEFNVTAKDIIKEIMAKKMVAMKQSPMDGHEPAPRLSSAIEFRINAKNLPGAAIVASCEEDIVALSVIHDYLIEGRNVRAPEIYKNIGIFDQIDEDGNTLLHYAARYGRLDIAEYLIPNAKCLNEPNKDGLTPFMLALGNGHTDVAMIILYQIDDSAQIILGHESLLHWAARNGWLDIVKVVLFKSTRINEPNKDGLTPFMLALGNEHTDVAMAILHRIDNADRKIL